MNDFNIHKSCPKFFYAFRRIPTTCLSFLSACFSFVMLFQATHPLVASEVNQVPNQIIVKYKDPSFSPLAKDANDSHQDDPATESADYQYTAVFPGRIDVVLIEGSNMSELIEELKNDPTVEYVQPNYVKQVYSVSVERSDLPDDTDFNKQWGLKNSNSESGADIDFLEALALSRQSTPDNPVIIAITDTSFASEHPDLMNQLWVNEEEIPDNGIDDDNNGYIDDIHGFDFVNMTPDVSGNDDHGSHVAGISAAENNNQEGISGVFPNVKFIALACSTGGLALSSAAILRAENYLIGLKDRGYNIVAVNASYGSNAYSQLDYESIQNLSDKGILYCTAAGNDGWNLNLEKDLNNNGRLDAGEDLNGNGILEVSYPNSYDLPNIISVTSSNRYRELASNSNYGDSEVDLAAPGEFIFSTINLDTIKETEAITLSDGTTVENQWISDTSNILGNSLSGELIHCGIGRIDDFPQEVYGNIALIERGTLHFFEKVLNAMNVGAIAIIIYNNEEENADGLRNWGLEAMANVPWAPSFSISQADGNRLLEDLPLTATLRPYTEFINPNSNPYTYFSGTSMASPVVTAAVAFAAHNFPDETMDQRRARILNNVAALPSLSDKVATGGVVNLRKIVDTDEDNLPDWWEMDHFSTLNNTNSQDSDNDGYSNRDEFLSKTNPTDASDRPSFKTDLNVSNLTFTNSDALSFEFMTHPGYTYTIQSMNSLSENTWNDTTQSNLTGDGIPMKVTIDALTSGTEDKQFYRLQATPE